jgi:NTP pyrophosphatase (non-canonical NTP hydrolase)
MIDEITYKIDLAIEEMSELIQALSKHKRLLQEDKTLRIDKSEVRENIKEEIADVNIVLIDLKNMYFENNLEIVKFISKKIERRDELLNK